jgi:hypothetical protein
MAGAPAGDRGTDAGHHGLAYLGASVEVRSRYDGAWCRGFEVAEVTAVDGEVAFRIRRLSDGMVLPALFQAQDVAVIR